RDQGGDSIIVTGALPVHTVRPVRRRDLQDEFPPPLDSTWWSLPHGHRNHPPESPPMSASPAQIAANRANSLKSTGPAPESRLRTRSNSRKHGLTGAGIALSTEDAAEVTHRFAALQAELKPAGALGITLV